MVQEPSIARCEALAREGKRRVDALNWTWPKRKKSKALCEENHWGEFHMVIPKQIKSTFAGETA